jgi:hypothetical protein
MPCCKHHRSAIWTMVMKNWYGILPHGEIAGEAADVPDNREHGAALRNALPELHLDDGVKEDSVVLDATMAQLSGGPSNGPANTQAAPGIVVASADGVAAEATGRCLLSEYRSRADPVPEADLIEMDAIFNTDPSTHLGRALTLGNGWTTSREQYTYVAVGLGDDEAAIMRHLDSERAALRVSVHGPGVPRAGVADAIRLPGEWLRAAGHGRGRSEVLLVTILRATWVGTSTTTRLVPRRWPKPRLRSRPLVASPWQA